MKWIVAAAAATLITGCASSSVQTVALNNDPVPDSCSKVVLRDFASAAVAMVCYDSNGRAIGQTPGQAVTVADAATGLARAAIIATGIGVGASMINASPSINAQ